GWTALAPSQDLPTRFADVAGEANGDMVAVGSTSAPSNVPNPAYADNAIIARFTPGGALDPSFGDGGRVTVDLGAEDPALAVAVQPDGRILVLGQSRSLNCCQLLATFIARSLPDGSLDPSFGDGGIARTGAFAGQALSVAPSGRIVVAGRGTDGRSSVVARYLRDGSPDRAFGEEGRFRLHRSAWDLFAVDATRGAPIVAAGIEQRHAHRRRMAVLALSRGGKLMRS